MKGSKEDKLCPLPWVHVAVDTNGISQACCVAEKETGQDLNSNTVNRIRNSDYFRNIRAEMLSGKVPQACSRCFKEEQQGYRSHRLIERQVWAERLGSQELEQMFARTETDGTLREPLMGIDVRLGNVCNLQCVMCRPADSSKWMVLANDLKETVGHLDNKLYTELDHKSRIDLQRYKWHQNPSVWSDIYEALPHMREIIIGGGEPLLVDAHKELIERCISSGHSSHILLRYHTNGTRLPKKLVELWSKFEKVELFVSIDGLGEYNEYMRYPSKWSDIQNNLKYLDSNSPSNIYVWILSSLHMMSMYHLPKLLNWLQDQNFIKITHGLQGYLHPGLVHNPSFLSIQQYPDKVKEIISAELRAFEQSTRRPNKKMAGVLEFMNQSPAENELDRFRTYVRGIDHVRNTDFATTFPELNELIQVY